MMFGPAFFRQVSPVRKFWTCQGCHRILNADQVIFAGSSGERAYCVRCIVDAP